MKILLFVFALLYINCYAFTLKDKYDMGDSNSGYKYAKQLFDKKEFKKSGEILFELIQRGDNAESFALLGNQIEYGLGVEKDCKMAANMYMNSAAMGNCYAYDYIIKMYKTGHCIKTGKNNLRAKKFEQIKKQCLEK